MSPKNEMPIMKIIQLLIIFSFSLLLASCSQTRLKPNEIRALPYSSNIKHITGIRQALKESPNQPVRILLVHGMITDEPKYSKGLQQKIANELGLILKPSASSHYYINRGYNFTPFIGPQPLDYLKKPLSEIRKTVWFDPKNPDVERLVFYEVLWSPFRNEIKNQLFACFESRSIDVKDCKEEQAKRNTDRVALINRALKDNVMINGFADPMIVLGPLGDVIRDDMSLALCMVASDIIHASTMDAATNNERCNLASLLKDQEHLQQSALTLQNAKFFAMTHSLGSFLFMDMQQRFAQSRAKSDKKLLKKDLPVSDDEIQESFLFNLIDDATIFMRANQIALLQLGRLSAEMCSSNIANTPCPNRLLRERADPFDVDMPLGSMTTYVAFNDANDLLGFELPPYIDGIGLFGSLVNVSVQNPGWSIPWIFKNPSDAHTRHEDNLAVIKAMLDGIDIEPLENKSE